MNYYIEIVSANKAKNDMDQLVKELGYCNLSPSWKQSGGLSHFAVKAYGMLQILRRVKPGDRLFLQYPMKKFYTLACLLAHFKGAKVITLIHDLGAFRRHKLTPAQENKRLSHTDYLIVHNPAMKDHLLRHGCQVEMDCLGIFDYLSQAVPSHTSAPHRPWSVVYAGGLGKRRNTFIYQLDEHLENWTLTLYGKGLDETETGTWKHISYKGYMAFEDFIRSIQADFGLVWDGNSIDECTGAWGEYLKINTPHKTSFYLRSGIPVIVWEESAMAPFVKEHNVGLCIRSLTDLNRKLDGLTADAYGQMKQAALQMSEKLGQGYFIKTALERAVNYLHKNTTA